MRVMVVGAAGFIGRRVLATLLEAGHDAVAAVRRVDEIHRIFPGIAAVHCDLAVDTERDVWLERIKGCDAVVNVAGVLQHKSARQIHLDGPRALYEACVAVGVRRIVHISAVSADVEAGTEYAVTKLAGESALRALDLDWVVLRPSLVYGEGSYGGTSLLRGLAGLPMFTPLPGSGRQMFQPLHVDDLCLAVLAGLTRADLVRMTLSPVGPDRMALADILSKLRAWLGFAQIPQLRVPMWLVTFGARVGDTLNLAPFNTTSFKQLEYGNVAPFDEYVRATGLHPAGFDAALRRSPANVQDRWHARLYFPRLCLRFGLAAFWLLSGLIGLIAETAVPAQVARVAGVPLDAVTACVFAGCAADLAIGLALLFGWRPRLVGLVQIGLALGYPLLLGIVLPSLLLDPLGPLVKNLPLLLAVVVFMCLADDR